MDSTKTLMSTSSRHLEHGFPMISAMLSLEEQEHQQWLNDPQAQKEYQQWLEKEYPSRKQNHHLESLESKYAGNFWRKSMSNFFVESSGNKEFKMVPAGSHLARCYRIVDVGTQSAEWQGQQKYLRKVMVGWEIHGEEDNGKPLLTDEGEPLAMFKNYTLSWSENANLRKDLQGWRGVPWSDAEANRFDLKNILGQWCMLNVIHAEGKNNKVYANVAGISPVPGMIKKAGLPPNGINPLQMFRLAEPDWEMYETFSKGLKAKIEMSPEFKALKAPSPSAGAKQGDAKPSSGFDDMDDDIPF